MDNDPAASKAPQFGINLYGYLTSNIGLGVAGRNTARMLLRNETPVRLLDVSAGRGMQGQERSLADEIERSTGLAPYAINLFHLNPDQMVYLLNPLSSRVTVRDRMQVCVPFWELPKLPPSWRRPLAAMDLILAPTRYIEETIRAELPDARIVHFPQAVHLPDGIEAQRARFGLPEDVVVFVTSFDLRSDIERKNPWASIAAFRRAFPGRTDVRLVIKVNNAQYSAAFPALVQRLNREANDDRIIVLDRPMGYAEVLALYASSDVLVSLHRAEGLGLSLLEAMALGRPVITTAYSGNMDFTTADNSCLVGFEMTPVVASTQVAYSKAFAGDQEWAEPSVDEAASHMRRLADDEALRTDLGRRAKQTVDSLRDSYDLGVVIDEVRHEFDLWRQDPDRRAASSGRMRALERRFFPLYGKRIVQAAWLRAKAAVAARR